VDKGGVQGEQKCKTHEPFAGLVVLAVQCARVLRVSACHKSLTFAPRFAKLPVSGVHAMRSPLRQDVT